MRKRTSRNDTFEWLCAALILAPCAALAQQSGPAPAGAAGAQADAPRGALQAPTVASGASQSAPGASQSATEGARGGARAAPAKSADDPEPAVDTSAEAARARRDRGRDAQRGSRTQASGQAMDHLELGTTDITGNRELPKVMYIVPWKRSDLGDLTGKPLNSLIDQTLEPVDRNVFRRENRYYGAVTGQAAGGAEKPQSGPAAAASGAQGAAGPPADRRPR